LCHVYVFYSQSCAKCFKSLLEYSRGLQGCMASLSHSLGPGCPWSVLLFSCIVWSIFCDADRMLVAMSLSWCRLGRFSNSNPSMVPARRRMRSVGSLRWLISKASECQWLKLVMILGTCVRAVKPLSEFLFMAFFTCSIPICVALSPVGGAAAQLP